ncbi:hypothetical protein J2Z42_001265 [Clostridium algifaecis]|uniref:Uncharacterized protein n=1 Tax=Clostridium algifaecis TaxID=1472040 RepID=A0ABS4KRD5_9CLOT|nr:hypothetical protein [Clostridium algifaecis]MBP2032593.1 hypothetical protein [Clostridium algifaecis]
MKFSRKAIIIFFSILMIAGGFIISHISPSASIRTHIFVTGHPVGAFSVTININKTEYNFDKDVLNRENAMIYNIMGNDLYDRRTGNIIVNYKVKRIGFLYFTEGYGDG